MCGKAKTITDMGGSNTIKRVSNSLWLSLGSVEPRLN